VPVGLTLLIPPSLGHEQTAALAATLADSLGRHLQLTIEVDVARTYEELEARAIAGDAALIWAPPSVCARVHSAARMILKVVRSGHASYRAALFCRADEPIDLEELSEDVRVAWVDPLSAAGYLLPRQHLRDLGLDPDMAMPNQRFFGSFGDAARAVVQGHADLSSIFTHGDGDAVAAANLVVQVGDDASALRVIAITEETASDGLIIGAGLSDLVAGRLVESLLADGDAGPDLVRGIFDAETLMVAAPDDYEAIRTALANER